MRLAGGAGSARAARRVGAALLVAAGVSAVLAGPAAAQNCGALSRGAVEGAAPSAGAVERLQAVLYDAYPDAPQADEPRSAFVDGIVGRRTLGLTRRLCLDLGLDPMADPASRVVEGAAAVGAAMASEPGWRATLASDEFTSWAGTVPAGPRFSYYRVGADGPVAPTAVLLLPSFQGQRSSAYVLTEGALATLAEDPQETLWRLSEEAVARLRAWGAPSALAGAVAALRDLPAASAQAVRTRVRGTLGQGPVVSELGDTAGVDRLLAIMGGDAMAERTDPDPGRGGGSVPEEMQARLARLQDIRFPDRALFRDALRVEAGLGPSRPALRARVEQAARAPGTAGPVEVKPIEWDGICGCGTFVKNSDEYPLYLYGMVPFWAAPQAADSTDRDPAPEVEVDFSLLTRVGYYALGFDEEGRVGDPLHWRTDDYPEDGPFWRRSSFAHFAHVAHQHKTEVDLVLRNGEWNGWLPGSATDSAEARTRAGRAVERLTADAASLVADTLGPVMEVIKPVISLGQSPRRTLGDGVTLDLDLSALPAADEAWLAGVLLDERILPRMAEALARAGNPRRGFLFEQGLDYQLNLVVPGYCMVEAWGGPDAPGCALYGWEALAGLRDSFDLLLVDFTREPPVPGAWSRRPSELALSEALDQGMQVLPVEVRVDLLGRTLPLLATGGDAGRAEALDPVFRHADWNFGGAAMWSVPLDSAITGRVAAAFIREAEARRIPGVLEAVRVPLAALDLEARVCRVVCPLRWPLRTFVFLTGVALLALWVASFQWLVLKRAYQTPWMPAVFVVVGAALMATLWCDPYWSERKSTILFLFLGGLMAWLLLDWARKRRWYP